MNIAPLVALFRQPGRPLPERLERFVADLTRGPAIVVLHDSPAMLIAGAPTSPHILLPCGGLIWGHVFDRHTSRRIESAEELRGADDPAERFVERCWGAYLAIRMIDGCAEVHRDPSGGVPCYHATVDGTEIFTSRPELLFDHELLEPAFDWTILAQAIAYRDLRPARTALRGVSELLPGMAARLEPDGLRTRAIWSPWPFASRTREVTDADHATELVRRIAPSCIGAWRNCFERPLVEISGGLDSAIVAALLCGAGRKPVCMTFAAAEGDPDETPYARAVAAHLGLELHVLRPEMADIDLTRSHARDLPRPCARGFAQAMDKRLHELAADARTDAFFSGGGGDNVFCYLQSVLPVIDAALRRGIGGEALGTMSDMALLAQVSVWEVAAKTLRGLVRRRAHAWKRQDGLLSAEASRDLPMPFGHPWLDAPPDALPGKRAHVRALTGVQNHLEGHGRLHHSPIVSPLLSQPLVEACLSIPSWLWCTGGRNRAIARAAFRDKLPAAIIERRTKGAFDGYCAQIVAANHRLIREMLLDGALVRHRLVDAPVVEALLRSTQTSGEAVARLLTLVDVEAWAAEWAARPRPN
jgi:asparagine synthase (glutamine-hydrolysing)